MKIYTKSGDNGTTALADGKRVPKYHLRIETYGTIDELNSQIGLLRDKILCDNNLSGKEITAEVLVTIQQNLFNIGASLSYSSQSTKTNIPSISEKNINFIENEIDKLQINLPPLRNFIIPGGHILVSHSHVCRCVCRRAERLCAQLSDEMQNDSQFISLQLQYLNRLSDYLFVLSRALSEKLKIDGIIWDSLL